MNVIEVRERVKHIEAIAVDDEAAHAAEDNLHRDVLAAIAAKHPWPRELAEAALGTRHIKFARWCA